VAEVRAEAQYVMTAYKVTISGEYRLETDQSTSAAAASLAALADVPECVSNVRVKGQPTMGVRGHTAVVGDINRSTIVSAECREAAIEEAFEWEAFMDDGTAQIESVHVEPTTV